VSGESGLSRSSTPICSSSRLLGFIVPATYAPLALSGAAPLPPTACLLSGMPPEEEPCSPSRLGGLGGLGILGGFGILGCGGGLGSLGCGGGLGCSTQPRLSRYSRCTAEFQWFLTELSVRPGSILAISAHLLPC